MKRFQQHNSVTLVRSKMYIASSTRMLQLMIIVQLLAAIVSAQYQEEFDVLQPPLKPQVSSKSSNSNRNVQQQQQQQHGQSLYSGGFGTSGGSHSGKQQSQQRQNQQHHDLPKYYTGNVTARQFTGNNSTRGGANDDVLAELRHCSIKSSKDVTNCHKSYENDLNQYGRRGSSCCAYVKFKKCLDDSLILPCNKYIERLIDLYVKEKPVDCETFSYPSFTCMVNVHTNYILGTSFSILFITFCCGFIYICKCFCRCCKYCCTAKIPSSGKSSNQPSVS